MFLLGPISEVEALPHPFEVAGVPLDESELDSAGYLRFALAAFEDEFILPKFGDHYFKRQGFVYFGGVVGMGQDIAVDFSEHHVLHLEDVPNAGQSIEVQWQD